MITTNGSLTVTRREGSRGSFSVGDLTTPVGEFKVKDTILDQFEPGTYRGTFVIAKIFASAFVWRGRVIAEIRASLADVLIEESKEGDRTRETPPKDPDPIDEKPSGAERTPEAPAPNVKAKPTPATPAEGQAAVADADVALFGQELAALVAARDSVKLDPTVDREAFRRQRDRLKALGYRFDAKSQSWQANNAEGEAR